MSWPLVVGLVAIMAILAFLVWQETIPLEYFMAFADIVIWVVIGILIVMAAVFGVIIALILLGSR